MSVEIAHHSEVYGREFSDWPWLYYCYECKAYVGMHPFTNIPLGTLADKATREARKATKTPFEKIHKGRFMSRDDAYSVLAQKLGISVNECHFAWFDIPMCIKAASAIKEMQEELFNAV